jgi:hypothetical protein
MAAPPVIGLPQTDTPAASTDASVAVVDIATIVSENTINFIHLISILKKIQSIV